MHKWTAKGIMNARGQELESTLNEERSGLPLRGACFRSKKKWPTEPITISRIMRDFIQVENRELTRGNEATFNRRHYFRIILYATLFGEMSWVVGVLYRDRAFNRGCI